MAKAKQTEEQTQNLPATQPDLSAMFTDEERAALLGMTGQAANFSFDKTPTLKINKFPVEDKEGNTVPMGNFVLGQVTKQEGEDTSCEFIGKDFGKNPEITILKFGSKFSYFPQSKDKKLICQSQLVLDPGEKAVGDNLGYECMSGKCPRRAKDVDKKEKCTCQYVAFVEVGPEREKALMYFKGTSFIPFKSYLDSAGKFPMFCYPTKLKTERKINGTNVYWIITPELLKDKPYSREQIMEYAEMVKEIDRTVRDFEAQRKLVSSTRREDQQRALPPGMSVLPPESGGRVGGGGGSVDDTDDICF